MANEKGVWRTIGGRRVFIKEGQDLASAMKESGKFKSAKKFSKREELKKDIAHQVTEAEKNGNTAHAEAGKRELERLNNEEKAKKMNETMDKRSEIIDKLDKETAELDNYDKYNLAVSKLENTEGMRPTERQYWAGIKERYEKDQKANSDREALRNTEKEYGELSKKMQADDYYYKPEDDRKLKELRAKADSERARQGIDTQEKYDKLMSEDSKASNKEQFSVSDLKKKAQATLPKEDIDTHEGDLYLKKTKESTELLNNMKDKDSGLLTTFKDQETGETWYDIPFANMGDDYKEKTWRDKIKDSKASNKEDFQKWRKNNDPKGEWTDEKAREIYENSKPVKYDIKTKSYEEVSKEDYKGKTTNDIMNEKIRSRGKSKVEEDDLPKHTEIKTQGTSNRKEVSENIQAHILDYYTEDYTGENISPSEAFVRQMDAMGESNMWRAGQKIAEGGSYLIYNGDMADFLDELKINPKGKKFSEDKAFDMYTSLIGRESAKLYDRIQKNSYKKYMKSHPLSKMSFEEFKDMNKK